MNPNYTFNTFVKTQSNAMAYDVALTLTEATDAVYNPLILYGASGTGKTHLLHAIGNRFSERFPRKKCLYISATHIVKELYQTFRWGGTDNLKNKYLEYDVLLIDDSQHLSEERIVSEMFLKLIGDWGSLGNRVVLASNVSPNNLLEDKKSICLVSQNVFCVKLDSPSVDMRIAILRKKAEIDGLDISDDVLAFIANNSDHNTHDLVGTLIQIVAYSAMFNDSITVDLAKAVIGGYQSFRQIL